MMHTMRSRVLVLFLISLLLLSLCSCTKVPAAEPVEAPAEVTPVPDLPGGDAAGAADPVTEPITQPSDELSSEDLNPLTGLADGTSETARGTRPVAIMVSNIITSLPQWGVSDADILIEMLAEGRITRFMALYQDPARIDHIASIRSARPYFIDMAQSFGAVYIHFGGSVPAYEAIAARKELVEIDGISGNWEGTVFFRDPDRKAQLGSEHSVYTTGALLQEGLGRLQKDLTLAAQPSAFRFGESSAAAGEKATKVQITFSDSHKPWFEYDQDTGEYLRFEYGAKQIDGWTNEQISVKNLLLLRMDTSSVPGSSLGLIEIATTGTGEGFYFCGGQYIPITWKKDSYDGKLTISDAAGNDVVFAPGQTFISCILRTGKVDIW